MLQFDGASEPKPVNASSLNPTRGNTQKSGVRKRFANIFGNRKRTETGLTDIEGENQVEANKSPMRVVSPRATRHDPLASASTTTTRTKRKRRTFSFKNRHSNHDAESTAGTAPQPKEDDIVSASGGHLLVTDTPYQSPMQLQPQKESVGLGEVNLPASPARDAALTSHPVGKIEIESESDEKFETPVSEEVSVRSGFFGKR